MGRPRKNAFYVLALSLDAAALALDCRRKALADAVKLGKLPAYKDPTSNRVRVIASDLVDYVRTEWSKQ
jgi:hypothetical protein